MAQVLSAFIVTHGHQHGAPSLTRLLPFLLPFPPVCPPFSSSTSKLFLELHYTIVMANLRCSAAEESEGTYDVLYLPQVVSPTS